MTIVFPDYPTKLQVTNGRRKVYFEEGSKIPRKYTDDHFIFKHRPSRKEHPKCLYNSETKEFLVKNEKFVDVPRYQSLSYNKISTKLKIPVLIMLKNWMSDYIPRSLNLSSGPINVFATVYDWPIPLNKDLDNMHIYYKAFLDLLKQRGLIKDDSKLHITMSGGFRFIPISNKNDRKLVFTLIEDGLNTVNNHRMYNLEPKEVLRRKAPKGFELSVNENALPGKLFSYMGDDGSVGNKLSMNFGKTKIIRTNADKLFREVFNMCINYNMDCWVTSEFYRIHGDRIYKFLLNKGIQVYIKTK